MLLQQEIHDKMLSYSDLNLICSSWLLWNICYEVGKYWLSKSCYCICKTCFICTQFYSVVCVHTIFENVNGKFWRRLFSIPVIEIGFIDTINKYAENKQCPKRVIEDER